MPVIFLNAFFFILDDNKSTSIRTGKGLFEFSRDVVKQNEKIKNREIIHSIIRYLDSNYTENYNRQELAEKFKIHDNYMVQLFKKHTGSSISGYINNLRIKASIKLMKNDDSKIVDIAYHVGYNNLTYFYRAFKSFTGMTPNEYRAEGNNCEDLQKKIDAKDS
ncbi:MAG: helix-turn-helix transcriptional regulator [Spirochaetes bacterium]|nr:helix-turn-helix transcriptional regulator [Spirochaetota bacterium]